jgi:hypothetical protein
MQAKKIVLTPYTVDIIVRSKLDPETNKIVDVMAERDVDPEFWLRQHILSITAQHNGDGIVKAMGIAKKLEASSPEEGILLDIADWNFVVGIINRTKGYTEPDFEMVRRVRDAPLKEVAEKKPLKSK